ncbi:MAG: patatin-like phospholipase family protein [Thermoplasmatota archaeon]
MKALVIEGGGMKASFANGVLSAFEEVGYHPWDAVIGTSAGGALGCWYSAGQARYAENTWKYAQDSRVLSWGRFLTGKGPYLDHEALIDIVYTQENPIDVQAIKQASWPVVVTTIEAQTGKMHYQDVRNEDVIAWIKATGRLPMMSGPPVNIDGVDHFDGGVADPIPIQYAVEELGATDVTLITNNHAVKPKEMPLAAAFVRKYPALKPYVSQHQALKLQAMEYARNPPSGVAVHIIQPEEPHGISRLSKDLDGVMAHLERGRAAGKAFANPLQV